MSSKQPSGVPHRDPLDYTGPNKNIVPIETFSRRPLSTDKKYNIGQQIIVGKNPTTGVAGELWYLASLNSNGDALWVQVASGAAWSEVTSTVIVDVNEVVFTDLIEFDEYKFQLEDIRPFVVGAQLQAQLSDDNGVSYLTGKYSFEGNGVLGRNLNFIDVTSGGGGEQGLGAINAMFGWFILDRNTSSLGNEFPAWHGFNTYGDVGNVAKGGYSGGVVTNLFIDPIDAVRWTYDNGNLFHGEIRVFGR
jgi:hypothetical protein